MKTKNYLPAVLWMCCFFSVFTSQLFAQAEKAHNLDEFVGEYIHLIIVEQPDFQGFLIGKAEFELTDANTINGEFKDHNIEFAIEYNPKKNNYLFNYKMYRRNSKTTDPSFSINGYEMDYTEEDGYLINIVDDENNWRLAVEIIVEDEGFKCQINSVINDMVFKQLLEFTRSDS